MNTLHLNFNSNLNLNLNSLLVLLPFLPRHLVKRWGYSLSATSVGKKNRANTNKTFLSFSVWALAEMVAQYLATQLPPGGWSLAVSPPGPSHSLIASLSLTSLTGMPVAQVNPIGSV